MRNDRKINVFFSANAEDYIRRFMKVAEETMPSASLVPVIEWYISKKFTSKVTGEVRTFGPGVDVGAIGRFFCRRRPLIATLCFFSSRAEIIVAREVNIDPDNLEKREPKRRGDRVQVHRLALWQAQRGVKLRTLR